MENYRESIENRKFINIKNQIGDNQWDIKKFYENIYLKNKHPILIVFPNAQTFIDETIKLKSITFNCLLEL